MRKIEFEGHTYVARNAEGCKDCAFDEWGVVPSGTGCSLMERSLDLYYDTVGNCNPGPAHAHDQFQVIWIKEA